MFRNIFIRNKAIDLVDSNEIDLVLRLMFEIAMSDGRLDKMELDLLKKRAEEISSDNEKTSDIIKKVIDGAEASVSLYPTVKRINSEYSVEQKKEVLKTLWTLVAVDGMIDHYEENLYFKIADLLKIRRSQANQIKQENS